MNKPLMIKRNSGVLLAVFCVLFSPAMQTQAASTDIANVPMAVKNSVTPNLLLIYDNSQSMDAYMAGTLVSGNDPFTRSNIARQVIRNAITSYRSAFDWGLMSFGMSPAAPTLKNTFAYYMGSDSGTQAMVFTDDCVPTPSLGSNGVYTPGVSASNSNLNCLPNPQPFTGGTYVTYGKSADDPSILDVLYTGYGGPQIWGVSGGSSAPTPNNKYWIYQNHNLVNSWTAPSPICTNPATPASYGDFALPAPFGQCPLAFLYTDAGFLPGNPPYTRQLYLPRGWGYIAGITGKGTINEPVSADSTTHYNNLQALLAGESNGATGEIKNGAEFTPLKGSLDSAKTYFESSYESKTSPIAYSCQQNFVMMVTDGLPTGKTDGSLYSPAERTNTLAGSVWTYGTAATDAINAVKALRSTTNSVSTNPFDIQTYVVALGDTVANAGAVAVMNAMANAGGTGAALFANNAASFQAAITSVTDSIIAQTGSSAAVAVANAHVTSSGSASYRSTYNSGTWTGDLDAYSINATTGAVGTTSIWTAGSAKTQLDGLSASARKIVTSTAVAGAIGGLQFQATSASTATKLSAAQQTSLDTPSASPADGADVLAYLRGNRSGETAGNYRVRAHLLGDIVNAEPIFVRGPRWGFLDTGYSAFKTANVSRAPMVYQGANDGMLHAFNATTGAEEWAYIPNLVMGTLNNLSRKSGFKHQYYVDATGVASDVDFNNTDGASGSGTDWRTILVSGLGKGGRGYFALDVTTPIATSEADLASKVLWEFPNSISNTAARNTAILNSGYSFGKPIIVKTKAKNWVVLVTSGYNNGTNTGDSGGDGFGHLYVINPRNGDLIADLKTTGCHATPASTPCGLAQISAYADAADVDATTDYVYGGDLLGNVWRFDLTGNSTSSWGVTKFAVLKDTSGAIQPITSTPELTKIKISGVDKRFVYVGTGQYLGDSDVPCPSSGCPSGKTENASAKQTQTMYGLIDPLTGSLPDPLRTALQEQALTGSGATRTSANNTVDFSTKKGWFIDLPTEGERVYTDPALALGMLIFTSNIPTSTICVPGGSSWLYFINYQTGGKITNSSGPWSGQFMGNTPSSAPVVVQLGTGDAKVLVNKPTGIEKIDPPVKPGSFVSRRTTWRQIIK